jgi:hypothetical protein
MYYSFVSYFTTSFCYFFIFDQNERSENVNRTTTMAPTTSAKNQPTLPRTLKVRKAQERAVQKLVFNELLQHCRTNGGKLDHGDILKII